MMIEPERMCYPYLESVKSFLDVCDEIVCVHDPRRQDGSKEKLQALGDKIRIVPAAFDLDELGWLSYAIARTTGYQACNGDIILMFDADGVLHEKDQEQLKDEIKYFFEHPDRPTGYWLKHRFYTPTRYWQQNKHSGIYNKGVMGDRFDFYKGSKGVPNTANLPEELKHAKQFSIRLFGYEHLWDTKEVIREKVLRYGKMSDRLHGKELLSDEQYWNNYIENLKNRLNTTGKHMPIEDHPQVVRDKLRTLNETHFGYNFFGN